MKDAWKRCIRLESTIQWHWLGLAWLSLTMKCVKTHLTVYAMHGINLRSHDPKKSEVSKQRVPFEISKSCVLSARHQWNMLCIYTIRIVTVWMWLCVFVCVTFIYCYRGLKVFSFKRLNVRIHATDLIHWIGSFFSVLSKHRQGNIKYLSKTHKFSSESISFSDFLLLKRWIELSVSWCAFFLYLTWYFESKP